MEKRLKIHVSGLGKASRRLCQTLEFDVWYLLHILWELFETKTHGFNAAMIKVANDKNHNNQHNSKHADP